MIKIGVSSCFMYPDPNRLVFGHKSLSYLENDMGKYLAKKGVMPILIPDLEDELLYPFLEEMDAFVFQGGSDVSPQSYKEPMIENGRWPGDRHRDLYELKIMDWAFKNKKPILAICRGFQICNVYFGGTLYQDLNLQTKTKVEHRNAEQYDKIYHEVHCTKESLLKDIYKRDKLTVNSVHHQGVKDLGKNLIVDAHCPEDSLIEAFHYKDMKSNFVLAVQWHPEFSHTLKDKVVSPEPLLKYFFESIK